MAKKCGSPNKFVGSVNPGSFASIGNAIRGLQAPVSTSTVDPTSFASVGNAISQAQTPVPPASGMQQMVNQGLVRDNFGGGTRAVAEQIYGDPMQRQMSMVYENPIMFEDQTGDGKITQADVIKARTEGYKE